MKLLSESDQRSLHRHSSIHRETLLRVGKCGCFYCSSIFDVAEVTEWVDHEQTALCPRCGIDSVIPGTVSDLFGEKLLSEMYEFWFGNANA